MRRQLSGALTLALLAGSLLACKQQESPTAPAGRTASERAAARPKPQPITLPAETELRVSLLTRLSSDDNAAGDTFEGTLTEPVLLNGKEVIPKHAKVWGKVSNTVKSGRLKQRAELWATLTAIEAKGKKYNVSTSTAGEKEGSKAKRDIILIGGGTGAGAAIGGAAGGGKGAGIGAAIGAGAGTAIAAATGKRDIVYPPETVILFRLSEPLTIS